MLTILACALFIFSACTNQKKEEKVTVQEYTLFKPVERPAPETTGQNDGHPIETGVKFQVAVPGKIIGLKFFKAASDTGMHTASIWDRNGNSLVTAAFSTETDSGWQEVRFVSPVAVLPGLDYVASCFSAAGFYSYTLNTFHKPMLRYPLSVPAQDSTHLNGVYSYSDDDKPVFPVNGFEAPNYWVDIIFMPDQPIPDDETAGPVDYSFFTEIEGPSREYLGRNDGHPIETGLKFHVAVPGAISGVRFFKAGSDSGSHIGGLWTIDGNNLASAPFNNEPDSGWQETRFANPVQVLPGITYLVSCYCSAGIYSYTPNALLKTLDRYPLKALAQDSMRNNGVWTYCDNQVPVFPTNGFEASNYWVDVIFNPVTPLSDSIPHTANQ